MPEQTPRRVLVINDDCRLANSVRQLLNSTGYEAVVAFDGQEGLDILREWPADLVLLDLIMPRLDGWAFLDQLASQPTPNRPTVLVWSVAPVDDLERARELGATACLPRGSTGPDQLLVAIERLLADVPSRV
jgi:CheY-like chemotaxis protein